jgi:MFS family permease
MAMRSHKIYTVAIIGFIFTLHVVIPMYSNSSFLNLFADESMIGLIYMAGAAVSILGYILAPLIIRRLGNYATTLVLICIQIVLYYGLISSSSPGLLATLFIIQSAVSLLIGFCLDIFLEGYSDDNHVGTIRGLYSATLNASWVFGPLIGSLLINGNDNYVDTYVASLAILFPLLYLVYRNFPRFHDPNYSHPTPWHLVKKVSSSASLSRLLVVSIILNTFYSWMVVYSPIYLNKYIGFSWEEIGIIFVIMLLPFPLIQYPLGKMSDQKYGEKAIMAIGFAILGFSTILLSLITVKDIVIWSMLLFITRIGAATAEVMMETYLFKTISARDSSTLSLFRITRPASLFISSSIMIAGLLIFNFGSMFAVIGLFSLLALLPILTIKDVK